MLIYLVASYRHTPLLYPPIGVCLPHSQAHHLRKHFQPPFLHGQGTPLQYQNNPCNFSLDALQCDTCTIHQRA